MIHFKDIYLNYERKVIFNGFNLQLDKHTVITGDSGRGKSTLFNMLLGFNRDYKGEVWLDDLEVNIKNIQKIRQSISYVPQNVNLPFKHAKELFYSQFDYAQKKHPNQTEMQKIFEDFYIDLAILNEKTLNLSGGEKQRLLLMASLLSKKKVLLWDEPTSALDLKSKVVLLRYVNALKGSVLLSISHDPHWIEGIKEEVIL